MTAGSEITWKYPRHKGAMTSDKRAAMLAAVQAIDSKSSRATSRVLHRIAREYMFEEQGMVWPVWQALANNKDTPAKVIRDLEQKQSWYLDILLIQHQHASDAFLHRMKGLREDIQGKHAGSRGYDNNKELRAYAHKRVGMAPEDTNDDE